MITKTVYIYGPITGDPHYMSKFAAREAELKSVGFKVFNPAELGKILEEKAKPFTPSHEEYMNFLLPYLLKADFVSGLIGWENSKGARIEHEVAKATGKPEVFSSSDERGKTYD